MPPDEVSQGSVVDEGQQDTGVEGGQEQSDGLAAGFLSRIPENERDIVGKYVKQWDAGVTRRFQELHGKYKPYEELGDVEQLQKAMEIYSVLDEDPQRLYNALGEAFGYGSQQGQNGVEGQQQQIGNTGEEDNPLQSAFTELQGRFDEQAKVLEAVAQYILNQDQVSKQSQEDQELDQYVGLLKEEYGEFDEDYVLTKMYHGMSGEEAVQSWNNMVQQHVNQASQSTANLPTILSSSGGSAVPVGETQKLGSFSSKDIRSLVADVLAQAQQGAH